MPKTKYLIAGLVVLLIVAGAWFNRPESDATTQSTDDAYLVADYTNVAPQVGGKVDQVLVVEHQHVAKGDLLAVLDDRDLKLAVNSAQAALDAAQAAIVTIGAQIDQQGALIKEAQATRDSSTAALTLAKLQEQRDRSLVAKSSVTQETLDEAVAALAEAQASLAGSEAALEAAQHQLAIYQATRQADQATVEQASAALDTAKLNLSYARITAPITGTIGLQDLRVGNYIATGSTAMTLVPLDKIYVQALYRETQLAHVRPGQHVMLKVDALPGRSFTGTVDSIGPASNVTYSSVAPANATGNFTKVTQRLPVRILLDPDQAGMDQMRVGMSVEPTITTGD